MTLDKTSAQPLYLQIEELLRGWIESGKLRPGDRIPSELELAQTYGISRMTARRAIDTLVMEGILFRRPGKGTFVAQPKTPFAPLTVFSFSTAMRTLGLFVSTKVLNLELVAAPPRVARDLQLPPQEEVIFLRRLRYVENQPMAIHISYIPKERFLRLLDEDVTSRPLNKVMEEISGLRIVASRDYVEAALARPDEASLLGIRQGAPLLLIRGIVYAEGELPVRSTKSVFRGDHFRFFVAGNNLLEVKLPGRVRGEAQAGEEWVGLSSNMLEKSGAQNSIVSRIEK
ncbi:MAG: GntR family transcriptional regulator [Chloroflexi bacterium]|nr:GntR family transcriptional regulator [Chloroflexota bacterium]